MGSNAKPITGVMQVGSIPIRSIIHGLPWQVPSYGNGGSSSIRFDPGHVHQNYQRTGESSITSSCEDEVQGASPGQLTTIAHVAQLGERWSVEPEVAGSKPVMCAILIRAVSQSVGGGPRKWQRPQGRENRAGLVHGFGAQRHGNMHCWK